MKRRTMIAGGLAGVAGASGLAYAARLASRYGLIPPDSGGVWGVGETLTYATQRILMAGNGLAREFSRSEISKVVPVSGDPPKTEEFEKLAGGKFADWRLRVDGMVARPCTLSLEELKGLPMRSQITHQACEEGWSFIAEWTGVQLATVLNYAGANPRAKYVVYYSLDKDWWDSLDMPDAMHPQTLLAYGLNGKELPMAHGAPVRMRVARQLGYKSVKHMARITVTDDVKSIGSGRGSASPDSGYSWFAGI